MPNFSKPVVSHLVSNVPQSKRLCHTSLGTLLIAIPISLSTTGFYHSLVTYSGASETRTEVVTLKVIIII